MRQLTKDHSLVQEQVDAGLITAEQARRHPQSNVITRCIGMADDIEPDVFDGEARVGDSFLLASDGLTGMVDDRRIQQLLLSRAKPERIVDALIQEANVNGGNDNITAVVGRYCRRKGPTTIASHSDSSRPHAWMRMAGRSRNCAAVPRNILYALERAALALDEQNKTADAAFYRGIARKLAEARGKESKR